MVEHAVCAGWVLTEADLRQAQEAYRLGEVRAVQYLADGLMNRNWRLRTDRGEFVLKCVVDVTPSLARRNLGVVSKLGARGVRVCPAVRTAEGDVLAEIAGHSYALFPWVDGAHIRGVDLTTEQARALGCELGRIHVALAGLVPAVLPYVPDTITVSVPRAEQAVVEADRFLTLASEDSSAFAGHVTEFLEQRKTLLGKYAGQRPTSDVPAGRHGWTHGDFQHLNVLWRDGAVRAVLDWDRIRVRPLGEEVTRSATLLFGREEGDLDLGLLSSFVRGYRSVVEVGDGELADAAHRLWWKRMCDYWHLEFHYDRGDHSCDHLFLSASRFLDWWTDHLDEVQEAFAA
ncbi:phosphotransferase [Streptomyces sp. URMC 127]|uniref:phosphotransferase n=1 Tax=Streptomyces sp. URMC 127 TaxID=3423402 RepID=UPI003F1A2044